MTENTLFSGLMCAIRLQASEAPSVQTDLRPVISGEKPAPGQPGTKPGDAVLQIEPDGSLVIRFSLGKKDQPDAETMRKAGGAVARFLRKSRIASTNLRAEDVISAAGEAGLAALLEGLRLGSYQYRRYKRGEDEDTRLDIHLQGPEEMRPLVDKVTIVTEAVGLVRDWGHEPGNSINPVTLAERAKEVAGQYGLKVTILDDQQLREMGAGAIVAVGQGSGTPARMIVLEYPGTQTGQAPVALVGKAITFDTGGYSLKTTEGIRGMKYDKMGGITVLAALVAAARLQLPTPLVGVICAAENAISSSSFRPDDILRSLSGKTIEILTTDAEGRLVLADGLTYTQMHYQPRAIIDLATLTGGVVTALGRVRAGLMSNNPALSEALQQAGEATYERLWPLPLDDEYFEAIKGDDADLKNSGGREAHPIMGGIFLKQFIEDDTPWAHLDIAGMADTPKELPYSPKGATGFGVRLLIEYLQSL